MSVKDLPAESRPREKLLSRGPSALSDAELLAILLRTGIAGKGVLQMADELLQIRRVRAEGDKAQGFGGISAQLFLKLTEVLQLHVKFNENSQHLAVHASRFTPHPKVGILKPVGTAFASGQRVLTTLPRV